MNKGLSSTGFAAAAMSVMTNAAVACPEAELFSCPIGENRLAICLDEDSASYSFGPHGQPELELTVSFVTLKYHPWVGIGRWEQNWVSFSNGAYEYVVSAARDRLDDERKDLWEVDVTVRRRGERIVSLVCEKPFFFNVLEELWSRKARTGLCWSRADWTWKVSENCVDSECAC